MYHQGLCACVCVRLCKIVYVFVGDCVCTCAWWPQAAKGSWRVRHHTLEKARYIRGRKWPIEYKKILKKEM